MIRMIQLVALLLVLGALSIGHAQELRAPPPDSFVLLRRYLTAGPHDWSADGWLVRWQLRFSMTGYTEGVLEYAVTKCKLDSTNGYYPEYRDRVVVVYGLGDGVVPAYTPDTFTCITWGRRQAMSRNFWWAACDEAYAVLSEDFLSAGTSPNGFDLAALQADLNAL